MFTSVAVFLCGLALTQGFPSLTSEQSALVQEQAQEDYKQHQETVGNRDPNSATHSYSNGYKDDGSYGITFDNHDKEHRDRGYGYEKSYAYSRETAFFDFIDDKGELNAKDIVEKYGNSDSQKEENIFAQIPN